MDSHADVIAGVGLKDAPRKSRWPARMDLAQSGSGLVLGLFMWGHMFFVSSILISEGRDVDDHEDVRGLFRLRQALPDHRLVRGRGRSSRCSSLHALPGDAQVPGQLPPVPGVLAAIAGCFAHGDTTLWWVQVVTGFALFFLAAPHLTRC